MLIMITVTLAFDLALIPILPDAFAISEKTGHGSEKLQIVAPVSESQYNVIA
jgi:hypothetical protein